MSSGQLVAVLPDVHIEVVNLKFWRSIVEWLREEKPVKVVLLGDFLDLASVSRHVQDFDRPSLDDDLAVAEEALQDIKRAVSADIIWAEGNHETQVRRYLTENAPSVRKFADLKDWAKLRFPEIRYVGELHQPFSIGMVDLLHGHQFLKTNFSKHHSAKAADLYGRPGRTVMYGHTHKPQSFERPHHYGSVRSIGLGCVRSLNPSWTGGSPDGWRNEFATINLRPNGLADVTVVRFENGAFVWGKRAFTGKGVAR